MEISNNFAKRLYEQNQQLNHNIPSIIKAHKFIDDLTNFLFPIRTNTEYSLAQTKQKMAELKLDFQKLLTPMADRLDNKIEDITSEFFHKIPNIYENMLKDAHAFRNFDPAAKSLEGIIIYYPGFYSIMVYRLSHEMYKLKVPFLCRMVSEYAHSKTGIDIHPGATIGEHFLIDHGTGIVVGETCLIGNNVKLYQGVTLGALMVEKEMASKKRHPTIEDNVVIYAGSTILGGETVIGHDTIIGGNT
jgi:serine O-acetyltransferase